ncbi:MAG: phosphotransferase, partial [Bacteroidales bacterium]
QGIAGYNEMDYSLGTGSPAETSDEVENARGLFITCAGCAGFIPDDPALAPEFRIPHNPAHAGVYVRQALSFGQHPAGQVRITSAHSLTAAELLNGLNAGIPHFTSGPNDLSVALIADFNASSPSVMLFLLPVKGLKEKLTSWGLSEIAALITKGAEGKTLSGARFVLDEQPLVPSDPSLESFLKSVLTIENIRNVEMIPSDAVLVDTILWLFVSDGLTDVADKRLRIETDSDTVFEPHKVFLTRRLYTDSGRLIIKQIHGGYSAQTYQVTSFDHQGRKLRPTVLKIANRAMIARESERCQQFALPYILNNSAMVLGTEFFGETGALRYNFVGIGGGQTQLKWLTHYYKTWSLDLLEPLFDKIFLQILQPWYGQPIRESIYPYRDHDPRSTFFPALCETATDLLLVSPKDQYIKVKETGQKLINPYWFLQNEFIRLREWKMEYYAGICHGDLNMQNILLDEDMNVYLIDFSETKPRSVISDFARLEAIFLVDNAPMKNEQEEREYIQFISGFYSELSLGKLPAWHYQGNHQIEMDKNISLTLKMREYAFQSVSADPNPVPYCLALLEWILPIVCYSSASLAHKRLSMIVSGLLCNVIGRDRS